VRNPISISASVGIALYPDDGTTVAQLLTSADKSMYAQKRGVSVA
jgi:GGDEF domain-containing protein